MGFFYVPRKPEPEPEPDPQTEPVFDDVDVWRLTQLLDAGWPMEQAGELAARREVDLHRACELLENGCSVDQAWDILI